LVFKAALDVKHGNLVGCRPSLDNLLPSSQRGWNRDKEHNWPKHYLFSRRRREVGALIRYFSGW